jgi:hypothetical protein
MYREWLNAGIHKIQVEATGDGDKTLSAYDLEEVASEADAIARKFFEEETGYSADDEDLHVVCIPLKLRKSKSRARTFISFKVLISWENM